MPVAATPQDGQIYYEVHGDGAPVLLIAGLGGHAGWWSPQIAAFADKFKLVLHDHRGTGRSSMNRMTYSVPLLAQDVIALMDHLGIEAAHIVGHSTGAAMTQDIALHHPRRILSAVVSGGWPEPDFLFRRAFEIRRAMLRQSVEVYVKATPLFMYPPAWIAAHADDILNAERAAIDSFPPQEIMLSRIDAICAYGPGERLRGIACPTLVTCARDDILTPLYYTERIAALIPGAQSYIFTTGGHAMTQTRAAEFNAVIPSFIEAAIDGCAWEPPGAVVA